MKLTFILLAAIFSLFTAHAQSGRDSIFVQTYPDSVCIWNTDIPATCGAVFVTSASIIGDSIAVRERDTSTEHFHCSCNFDVNLTFFGLAAGTYRVFIYRSNWSAQDTFYVGSVDFTIPQPSPLPFSIYSNSSECHEIPVYIEGKGIPKTFNLLGNYPNPFNPETIIRFQIYRGSKVRLEVFGELGQLITKLVDEEKPAGDYEIPWNASKYSSGIYLCKLTVGNEIQTCKLILAK